MAADASGLQPHHLVARLMQMAPAALERGVFCVFRLHQRRPIDFRTGQRLGPDDQRVNWQRPKWIASMGISESESPVR